MIQLVSKEKVSEPGIHGSKSFSYIDSERFSTSPRDYLRLLVEIIVTCQAYVGGSNGRRIRIIRVIIRIGSILLAMASEGMLFTGRPRENIFLFLLLALKTLLRLD